MNLGDVDVVKNCVCVLVCVGCAGESSVYGWKEGSIEVASGIESLEVVLRDEVVVG